MRLTVAASIALAVTVCLCAMTGAQADDLPDTIVDLNNDGVRALVKKDHIRAIQKFEEALKIDRTYKLARNNLAIAYNNFGLENRKNPDVALKMFHKAILLDPTNETTRQNVEGIIRMMGLDPKSFDDRVQLGGKARKDGDYSGAIVEYTAALDLQDSAAVHEKLGDVYCVVDRKDKAIAQFEAGLKANYSAQLDKKLRLLRSVSGIPEELRKAPGDRDSRSFTLNNPMIALVAFPLLALLLAFVTRKKRMSIWFVGLAIAAIFALAGYFAL